MKKLTIASILIILSGFLKAQEIDTFYLHKALSKNDTVIYKRIIQFNEKSSLYHVKDYLENGQIEMDAYFSSFDRNVKAGYQCNYRTNTKENEYKEWHSNGQIGFHGNFKHGLMNGLCTSWYKNGQIASEVNWLNGQLHGSVKYYKEDGSLQFDLQYENGSNLNPKNVNYHYVTYLPPDYNSDTLKSFPLLIYLHGGSARGTDTISLYSSGPFDQVYRGREFPFIIVSPQCPKFIRWSTENWFESFYSEISEKYRIDTNRIYLTGMSLGGSGTWYLAVKYPEKFAAIAPMSGFTSHNEYINKNIERLKNMPIWAFHGKLDDVVQFEETERIVDKLEKENTNLKFTIEPEVGHWIHWLIYPSQELYDWFLQYEKNNKISY